MDLTWLQPVVSGRGPFTSVHIDVSRETADAAHEIELRWQAVRRSLEEQGAPSEVLDSLEQTVLQSTGRAGDQGRSVVVGADGVLLDRVVPRRPVRDSGHYGAIPHLMPLVRGLDGATTYVLVETDRAGAEITVVDPMAAEQEHEEVEGGHDVLHKVPGGGWSHRRFQSRVQDSWDRNAEAVAAQVDRAVDEHRPSVVLVTGDPYACSALSEALGTEARGLVEQVEGGGRAEGTDDEAFAQRVEEVLTRRRQERMGDVLARYTQAVGQDSQVAVGFHSVVEATRGAAVDTLLLHDEPSSDLRLFAGEDPMQIGTTRQDVEALGAQQVIEDRADAVLIRALAGESASITLVDPGDVLKDGIGALLRFDVRPPVPGGRG
ncbi:MAG: Vms1/Ankzf1 family peptidyl-tRNA hydrolase [Actinomycetes bacterium]